MRIGSSQSVRWWEAHLRIPLPPGETERAAIMAVRMGSTTRIQAVSYHADIHHLAPPLTIRAVFPRAWHIGSGDGWVLTVSAAPYNGPLGIRVEAASLDGQGVGPGTA